MKIDLYEKLQTTKSTVEKEMLSYLPKDDSLLSQAMKYSALAPGKRVRAFLVTESAVVCGGKSINSMPAACALEFIHAFSLIHDDLPAMDDDELRRGLPTCHIKYGEATAILAGDALFSLAFETIAIGAKNRLYSTEAATDVIINTGKACGAEGMCQGQSLDLLGEGKELTYNELRNIHAKKTGALIIASVFAGARLSNANEKQTDSLLKYASHIGLAFQIKDDILDVSGSTEELGKKAGVDQSRNKATYPSLLGMKESIDLMISEKESAISSLDIFDGEAVYLKQLAEFIVNRNK